MAESEAQLLERTARGDKDAFQRLFEIHRDFVFRVALGHGLSREDALDAVQETFVRLYRAAPDLRLEGKLGSWLYRVATNLSMDTWRERKKQPIHSNPGSNPSDPEKAAIVSDMGRKTFQCLEKLPRTQKDVFMLRFYHEKSIREIAQMLGKTPGSVRVHLFRALGKVRKQLLRRER